MDSNESPALLITHYTKWVVDLPSFRSFEWDSFVIDSPKGEDLILGYDFLYHFHPIINWKNGLITYHYKHKDSSGINSSTSNDLATAVNSVSPVVELKTPSLPSSDHIPYIIPSQLGYGPSSLEDQQDEEEEPEEIKAVLKVVSCAYHQYSVVFSKVEAEKLPPHRACDHHIKLEGLLPPKKDGGLLLCVDYCKLNAITRKNRYPVPPMSQLLTIFNGSTIFSKIDLCGAYNLMRNKEGDENLTTFRAKYGIYEYLVMPYGLTNASASFQNLVNDIFADLLNIFVVDYLDDIMFFSSSKEEHVKHVASVLQRLRDNNLFVKAS
ncbi:hypothetical protein O181_128798, partial [Austropuccinia psidii MF-1]|nr:hypothetical protein [Austropuccinia psidii MF-1]